MNDLSLPASLAAFWFDAPPLVGLWRLYLYGGLLFLALTAKWHQRPWGDSPLQAANVVGACPREFYEGAGVLAGLPARLVAPPVLRVVLSVTLIAWVATLLGAGGRVPPLVTGLGFLWLHGALAGAVGTNHRWMVPAAVLLGAGFSDMRGTLSVDAWLSHTLSAYPFDAPALPSSSGIVGRVALVASVLTLFAGGISKLRFSGLRWLDGQSIRFYVERSDTGAFLAVKRWVVQRLWVCSALAVFTMAVELSAPLALFSSTFRLVLLSSAAVLHLGIWMTMRPNYLPQAWCYALCFAPGAAAAGSSLNANPLVVGLLTLGSGMLFIAALLGIEWWPLTSVPMYAFYRDRGWSQRCIRDDAQARALGAEFVRSRLPYPVGWSKDWVGVAVRIGETRRALLPRGVAEKQWRRLLHRAAARHWAGVEPAAVPLAKYVGALRGELSPSEQHDPQAVIELVANFAESSSVLASLPVRSEDHLDAMGR